MRKKDEQENAEEKKQPNYHEPQGERKIGWTQEQKIQNANIHVSLTSLTQPVSSETLIVPLLYILLRLLEHLVF